MVRLHHRQRFGVVAITKGFITLDQFTQAMKMQANENLSKSEHRRIGRILADLGFMTPSQVNEVLTTLHKDAYMFECPKCRILVFKCPNCGEEPRKAREKTLKTP